MYFSDNSVPRRLYLISAPAEKVVKNPDFTSIDEKHVTEIYCLIGTSNWFAIVIVFDVSCILLMKITKIDHLSDNIGWFINYRKG